MTTSPQSTAPTMNHSDANAENWTAISAGQSYDNALAEKINGLYKTGLIKAQGPCRTVDQVEVATLEWVD